MTQLKGRVFFPWLFFFTILAFAAALTSCGSLTHGKESPLELSLAIPPGEDPQLFWYGVQKKALKVDSGREEEIPWEPGKTSDVGLKEGDKIVFLGTDSGGQLLVTGEATISQEKKATIPLRRVL
jgi:hypothetical protein